ncbi:MAG: penicillin-binding protein 2 [Sphaerochaeta sp.]
MDTSPNRSYYRFFLSLTLLLLLILLIRIGFVIHSQNPERKTYKDPLVSKEVVRGTLYDRNGKILAIQTPYWGVFFHLSMIDDLPLVSEVVAPFVGMSPSQILQQAAKYTTYAQIKKKMDPALVPALMEELSRTKLTKQVSVVKSMGRDYPATFHASQTIGFTNIDNEGSEGIELTQEAFLNPYPLIGTDESTYGEDITLTLDIDIQYLLDVQMQNIADEHNPDYGVAIVLDAQNGDILGMSSYPWYDPNALARSTEVQKRNHVANYLFEPGSVFKVFSLASVMESGQADLQEPFLCDGSYTFTMGKGAKATIVCTSPHGVVDPNTMIAKSCNGAISHWAMQTDEDLFYSVLNRFGFNRSYDIALPSRTRSYIADPSSWSGRSEATISFGQELSTTALHIATAATAFTNGGELLQPHLILQRNEANGGPITYRRERTAIERVISAEVANSLLLAMEEATKSGGTARSVAVGGVRVGAKTGTSQILNPETNSYEDGTVLASTLAIVPLDKPKYIIYVAAGNPKGNTQWGSSIASPAIGKIIESLVSQGKVVSERSGRR